MDTILDGRSCNLKMDLPDAYANRAGVAPSHADLQRFFNLTPPSVNSMLVRLERCGFIRRVPGKARAIEVLFPSAYLPPLERNFKF